MKTRADQYSKYLSLVEELNIAEENKKELENNLFVVDGTISSIRHKLKKIGSFTSNEIEKLIDEIHLEKFFNIDYNQGGEIENYATNFPSSESWNELTPFQKENYPYLEPYLKSSEIAIDECVTNNMLNNEDYSTEDCSTLRKYAQKIVKFHPDYEDFTREQRKKLKEIIHIFANHTLKT